MRTVVVRVPVVDAELAADRLWVAGARAVEERAAGRGSTELRTVLSEDDEISSRRLGAVPDAWTVAFEDAEEPVETWRSFARPVAVAGDLVIRPAWVERETPPEVVDVAIEPGGAFGLGDHPTTRLTAAATWRLVRVGDRVLDVGCGSGVLSVVAARRGAAAVVAVDVAEAARESTVANALLNGVGADIRATTTPVSELEGQFDLVLANILAPTLIELAGDLRRLTRPGGTIVVSGVLHDRFEPVLAALGPATVRSVDRLDGWAAVVVVPT